MFEATTAAFGLVDLLGELLELLDGLSFFLAAAATGFGLALFVFVDGLSLGLLDGLLGELDGDLATTGGFFGAAEALGLLRSLLADLLRSLL